MGRWMKDNWWLVLAAATGALLVAMGVLLPFEDRTRGALVGGIVIAGLGGLMLAGIGVRRRRRVRGDVMIAVGTLPLFPFVWTIVFPVLGLVIGIAALRDATDGRLVDHTEGPRRDRPASGDGTTRVLLGVVLVAVVAAIAIGEQDVAVVLVGPPLALLIAYLLLLPVRVAPLVRWGLTLLLTGVVHGLPMTAVLVWGDADAGFADRALPVSMSIVGAGGVLGLVLLVVGLARSRGRTRPV